MTPERFLVRVQALVQARKDQALLDFDARFGPEVHPLLSPEDMARVTGALHCAAMNLDLQAASAAADSAAEPT